MEPTFTQMIWNYLRTTAAYWWVIVPGALIPARDILNLLKRKPLGKTPRWLELAVIFACLSVAQFLAYRNTVHNLYTVIEEKRQYRIEKNSLNATTADLNAKLAAYTLPEAPDSLRRRTFKLADEFSMYLVSMLENKNKPPDAFPNSADPNPSEERKKEIQASQAYYRGIEDYYAKHFRDRFVGIVKEYENRGVRTGFLANDFAQRVPYIPQLGSVMDGLDEISRFRDLAYHVDARDHLITF
jgi:hypothetical protein